jgi:hypothetical protein
MKSEFVRFLNTEANYEKKHLLSSELEVLNILKSLRAYRELRKEEFVLKITLKNKVQEVLSFLEDFEKRLPKSQFEVEKTEKEDKDEKKKMLTLEQEIEEVRMKLDKLQGEM